MIQVQENIAGIAMLGIGQKINIMTLKVSCAQKAHHRSASQQTRIPNPFSGRRFSGEAMNHADEVEIIRHRRELALHGVQGKKESAIAHGHENAIEASRDYNDFSANGNNSLTLCLSPGVHPIHRSAPPSDRRSTAGELLLTKEESRSRSG